MIDNTATRLLVAFMFCSLFSVGKSHASWYGADETSGGSTLEQNEPLTLGDVATSTDDEAGTSQDAAATADETTPEESVTQEEAKVEAASDKTAVESSRAKTPARKVSSKDKRRVMRRGKKTGKTRKEALPSSSPRKRKTSQAASALAQKSEIQKLATFDSDGNIESFQKASDALVDFINSHKTLNPQQKTELYAAITKFRFILGRTNFSDDAHYEASLKVLSTASENASLFSKYQIKHIQEWKSTTEKEKGDPTLRKSQKTGTPAKKRAAKRGKGTPTLKRATSKAGRQ